MRCGVCKASNDDIYAHYAKMQDTTPHCKTSESCADCANQARQITKEALGKIGEGDIWGIVPMTCFRCRKVVEIDKQGGEPVIQVFSNSLLAKGDKVVETTPSTLECLDGKKVVVVTVKQANGSKYRLLTKED